MYKYPLPGWNAGEGNANVKINAKSMLLFCELM